MRGGWRPGAGRPKGARDHVWRGEKKKIRIIQEAEQFLRSNGSAVFEGGSLALLVSIYKNETLPLNIRQNAACAAVSYEHPRMSDARVLLLRQDAEKQRVIEAYKEADTEEFSKKMAEFERKIQQTREGIVEERDVKLQQWVAAGRLSPEMAIEIRGMWIEESDKPATFHTDMLAMPDLPGEWRPKPRALLPPPRPGRDSPRDIEVGSATRQNPLR
jgi:hypothetical protein